MFGRISPQIIVVWQCLRAVQVARAAFARKNLVPVYLDSPHRDPLGRGPSCDTVGRMWYTVPHAKDS